MQDNYQDIEEELDHLVSKKQKRKALREKQQTSGLKLTEIKPKTENQSKVFKNYQQGYNLLCQGIAGTGKTFISTYLGLNEIFNQTTGRRRLIIVRSVVPTRDMGFLPGTAKDKSRAYEAPYFSIFNELFGRGDAYEYLKSRGVCDFITTSFIRGITLDDAIIIVDECQNMSGMELHSIMTRVGQNSRIVFCGDFKQTDLPKTESGFPQFIDILNRMPSFRTVKFMREDIVRSGLVKEYIETRDSLGII